MCARPQEYLPRWSSVRIICSRLIFYRHIVCPSNLSQRMRIAVLVVLGMEDTLLTLDISDGRLWLADHRSTTACVGCRVHIFTILLATGVVAIRSERALAKDEFKNGLEGRNAGGDDNDVGLDAVRGQ